MIAIYNLKKFILNHVINWFMVNDYNEPIMKTIHLLINKGTLTFIYDNVYGHSFLINESILTFIHDNVYEGYKSLPHLF